MTGGVHEGLEVIEGRVPLRRLRLFESKENQNKTQRENKFFFQLLMKMCGDKNKNATLSSRQYVTVSSIFKGTP